MAVQLLHSAGAIFAPWLYCVPGGATCPGGFVKLGTKDAESAGFKPVTLEITFETQAELDTFGALFNYSPVTDAFEKLTGVDTAPIRRKVESLGGHCSRLHEDIKDSVVDWFRNCNPKLAKR